MDKIPGFTDEGAGGAAYSGEKPPTVRTDLRTRLHFLVTVLAEEPAALHGPNNDERGTLARTNSSQTPAALLAVAISTETPFDGSF